MGGHVEFSGGVPPNPARVQAILHEEAERGMTEALALTHAEALRRMERSRRTGHAMRSVVSKVERIGFTVVGVIGSNVFYVRYLEEGTGLYGPFNHWIVPRHARFLRFPQPGNPGFTLAGRPRSGAAGTGARYVYARRVRGIRPRRYFRDSAMVVGPRVQRIFEATGRRITERLVLEFRKGAL